ncbi:MAG: GDP-mannose dehydrogenase [Deltaproteobacteria bacterium]|nr:MAG: GDP-mannose dehydrogenase [Deltaproteobacteria bacterium]PIE74543.1 MAG: GDP-mannose dehydrogenase [Deltaproteobacteria bacterium]
MDKKIAVIGLGYVGLPLAVEFGKKFDTLGFDINKKRVEECKTGKDSTLEVTQQEMKEAVRLEYSSNPKDINEYDILIVAVPTPINKSKQPDLTPLIKASETVGQNMKKGAVVVFESTVYPGATEEVCVPVLERESSMKWKEDFNVGYSPERINPGDMERRLPHIKKVVSGDTKETAELLNSVYLSVIKAGTHMTETIKEAEAAKVIENTQRDLNIALINELSLIFDKMGIDTLNVLKASETKWNFLPFRPGLVGGHCIGVDPYYLTFKAQTIGYHPEVILSGRRINDGMGKYIAGKTIKEMIKTGKNIKKSSIGVLGFTFKEDCPDLRNTRVIDIIEELESYGAEVKVYDPLADKEEAFEEYGVKLCEFKDIEKMDAIILAVSHKEFKSMSISDFKEKMSDNGSLIDVKSIIDPKEAEDSGINFWRL